MPDADANEYPFTAFAFSVEIDVPNMDNLVCNASFAECDGLEMTMEVKTIREGGNNGAQIRMTGPLSYGQLSLKRGMTSSFDLWDWFAAVLDDPSLRAETEVVLLSPDKDADGSPRPLARFHLARCVPVKLKAPPLNAKDGMVAIEELQIAYESLRLQRSGGGNG